MPFTSLLTELVGKVPGSLGAVLADWEGEAVAHAGIMDEYELKVVGAHKGVILQNLRGAMGRLEKDRLEEVVVTTEKAQTLVLPVTEDYFLVLALARGDVLGRALFEARRCVASLKKEVP